MKEEPLKVTITIEGKRGKRTIVLPRVMEVVTDATYEEPEAEDWSIHHLLPTRIESWSLILKPLPDDEGYYYSVVSTEGFDRGGSDV